MTVRRARTAPPRAIALALLALTATGCARPTATSTQVPTATATTTPSPRPTASATPTSTPWPLDVPHPVMMTLEDARQEVLSWGIPANEARVERATYAIVGDLSATFPPDQPEWVLFDTESGVGGIFISDEGTVLDPNWETKAATTAAMESNLVLILVDSSQRGIDLDQGVQDVNKARSMCAAPSTQSRARFLSVFDATTGRYIGSGSVVEPWESTWVDALTQRPALNVVQIASPTPASSEVPSVSTQESPAINPAPTWTPVPVAGFSPDASPPTILDVGQVPAPVVEAARELAEVPGSRWIYRVTEVSNLVHWSQYTYTETIASAWRIAPDIMTNEHVLESSTEREGNRLRFLLPRRFHVFPNGGAGMLRANATLADVRQFLTSPPASDPNGYRSSPAGNPIRLPLRSTETYDFEWFMNGKESVTVPAGTFNDCFVLEQRTEQRNGSTTHLLCPGVGVVRREEPGCGIGFSHFSLYELIDYHIPPITPVP